MRFFGWIDFQYEMVAVFLGLIALVLVYVAWASYRRRDEARTPDDTGEHGGGEARAGEGYEKNPVAPFLIFTYVIIAAWWVSYLIYHWARSSAF